MPLHHCRFYLRRPLISYKKPISRRPAILKSLFCLKMKVCLHIRIFDKWSVSIFEFGIKIHKHLLSKTSNTLFQNGWPPTNGLSISSLFLTEVASSFKKFINREQLKSWHGSRDVVFVSSFWNMVQNFSYSKFIQNHGPEIFINSSCHSKSRSKKFHEFFPCKINFTLL